jgi:hypothetical protein
MIISSVLFVAGAHAAGRVRYNNKLDQASVEQYGAEHLGAIDMSKFLMSWNATMGPPPRGWYKAEFYMEKQQNNNEIIKKSGDDGQTKTSFDFDEYPKEHYCRFRIDDSGENDECCSEEDQNCYTKAGCYCDTACFTIYGDCCTDHFVTCYDDLKLCLKKVKPSEPQADDAGLPDLPGRHSGGSPRQRVNEMQHDFVAPNPGHVEPNACCGQEEYNDSEKCCIVADGRRKLASWSSGQCEGEEEEGADERAESPEPEEANYVYDEEE